MGNEYHVWRSNEMIEERMKPIVIQVYKKVTSWRR